MKSQCLHLSIPHKPGWPLFAIPSLVGIIFYLAPLCYQDAIATPIALLVTGLQSLFHDQLPAMITFNILPAVFLSLMVGGLLLPLLLNFDGFVKSPISALRFIPRHCGVR